MIHQADEAAAIWHSLCSLVRDPESIERFLRHQNPWSPPKNTGGDLRVKARAPSHYELDRHTAPR